MVAVETDYRYFAAPCTLRWLTVKRSRASALSRFSSGFGARRMVMTRQVETCKESDTVYELMERMTTGKFRHLPVIEDGRLAGIVP